jgi:hypothetical protein
MLLDRCRALGTSRMTHGRRWLAMAMVIGLAASFGQRLHADELKVYADECTKAIGAPVPDFTCQSGTEVPVTNLKDGKTCDRPDRLNNACHTGSRLKVLTRTADAFVVALCRSEGTQGTYNDIGVIQYSRRNGATCFYQKLNDNFSGDVTAPSKGEGLYGSFDAPGQTAEKGCVDCHDNGPFIRSPYLTQITGNDKLPDVTNKSEPYAFVGADFTTWAAYKVEVDKNQCITCHRLGVARRGANGYTNTARGTALDLSIRSTAMSETSKNPTSPNSPRWMPPPNPGLKYDPADAAAAIKKCALQVTSKRLPNTDNCRITLFAGAFLAQQQPK